MENCIVLGYQFSGLIKVGLPQDYLVGGQEESKQESLSEEQRNEVPIHGESTPSLEDFSEEVALLPSGRNMQGR